MNITNTAVGIVFFVWMSGIDLIVPRPSDLREANKQDAITNIKWMTIADGVTQARQTKKRILLDVCASWCPWCKQMDEMVYNTKEITDYIMEKYVPVRLNGEGKDTVEYAGERFTESDLADKLGTKGYPTTVFLNYDTEFMVKLGGYINKEVFLKVLQYIGEDVFEQKTFIEFAGTSLPKSDGSSSSARKSKQEPAVSNDSSRVKEEPR